MKYTYLAFIVFWELFNAHLCAADLKEAAPLYLEVGEQRILKFPKISRYSVSGDAVHYTRNPKNNEFLIKALKPGLATLYLSSSETENETHLIRVVQKKGHAYPTPLLQALNSMKSNEVIDGGDRFILRGPIESETDARIIAQLKAQFPTYIQDETTMSGTRFEKSKAALERWVATHPGLSLIARDGGLSIHGGSQNAATRNALIKQIKQIEPLTEIEIQFINSSDPTLYFKIFLLEVKKELISSLGVEWPATHPAAINLSASQLLLNNSLELTIHALSQKGLARVLSSPELVVKAPGQAELFAGGELPIRQRSKFTDSIVWKNIGLSLKLDVKEYGGEKVRLSIETEMSHLDSALTNDNIPGVQTNRIKTLVDGTLGKPLLLSGLLQEDLRESSKGLPGLSKLPILGKLFSSEDYQNSRSELVAILLPHREPPQNPMQRISVTIPKGYLPLPRNYLNEEDKETALQSSRFPWNVL